MHGTFWMFYSIISSFCSVYLLAKGYENAEIGVILASGNILAACMQPFLADFADRTEKMSLSSIIRLMSIILLLLTTGLFVFKEKSFLLSLIFILLLGLHTSLQPLINSLAFRISAAGYHINYGIARSIGSLGYSLICVSLGILTEKAGKDTIPISGELSIILFVLSIIFICISCRKNDVKAPDTGSSPETGSINLIRFIKRNRLFIVLNLGVAGLFFSNSILCNYTIQIVEGVGGDSSNMGLILAVTGLFEIPTLIFFDRLKMSFRCQTMMKIGAVGFTAKIAVIWLAGSVNVILFAQLFQLIAFGLFYPAMIHFINDTMSPGEAVKGQSVFSMTITAATIIASLSGGLILNTFDPKMLTFIAFLATAAGACIVCLLADRIRKRPSKT